MKKKLITGLILAMLLVPVSCAAPAPAPVPAPAPMPAPAPTPTPVTISTLSQACDVVDNYLYDLATTPEAKRLLAGYKENMWGRLNCTMVVDYEGHWRRVYSETEYINFPVKEYIVQHIFDSEFAPGSEALRRILRSYPSIYGCGPEWNEEISYPVTWIVQTQSGTVTAADGNALRVEAELLALMMP